MARAKKLTLATLPDTCTIPQVAEAMRVTRQKVHAWIDQGRLATLGKLGPIHTLSATEVRRFAAIPRPKKGGRPKIAS